MESKGPRVFSWLNFSAAEILKISPTTSALDSPESHPAHPLLIPSFFQRSVSNVQRDTVMMQLAQTSNLTHLGQFLLKNDTFLVPSNFEMQKFQRENQSIALFFNEKLNLNKGMGLRGLIFEKNTNTNLTLTLY